ncbi:hypothetical protein HK102_005527, partial [Quaeritorhiza haematococci]
MFDGDEPSLETVVLSKCPAEQLEILQSITRTGDPDEIWGQIMEYGLDIVRHPKFAFLGERFFELFDKGVRQYDAGRDADWIVDMIE